MATRKLEVQILGDSRNLERAVGRSEKSMGKLGAAAKKAGLGMAAGLGIGAVAAAKEAREAAKVGRQTDAVLKSTGRVANVSKKQIEGLAQSISMKAGVDDEAVQAGQNLLLTFKNIRNEAGPRDTFSRTTKAAVDMSAAMTAAGKKMTISDAMLQLGKAVNDPEKGMTRLTRSGVDFTNQQKEQVKALVASGQTTKAQAVILREVEAQFTGSAQANADGMDRLKVAGENLLEVVGGPLASALSTAGNALATFIGQVQQGEGTGGRFRDAMVSTFNSVKGAVSSAVTFVRDFLNRNREEIRQFGQALANAGKAIAAYFTNVILPVIRRIFPGIRQVVQGGLRVVGGIIRVFTGIFTGDFGKAWQGIKQIFSGALKAIGGIIRAATAPVRAAIAAIARPIGSVFAGAWRKLEDVAKAVLGGIRGAIRGAARIFGDVIASILRRFATLFDVAGKLPGIGGKFRGLADKARDAAAKVDRLGESVKRVPKNKKTTVEVGVKWPKILKDTFPAFSGGGSGAGWPLSEAIGAVARKGAQARVNRLHPEDLTGGVLGGSPFGPLGSTKGSLGRLKAISARMGLSAGRGPGQGFRAGDPGYHGVGRAFDSSGPAGQMMAFARHMAKNFGGKLLELIYSPLGFSIKNGRRVPPYAVADHYDHVHVAAQRGAMVPGSGTGDRVGALLEPGEGIINKKAVAAMGGRAAIDTINRSVPRFQAGGVVGRVVAAARGAGFKGNLLRTMAAIAMGESGGNPRARGDGGQSHGLWQIYRVAHPWARRLNLFNPATNARAAMRVYRSQGLGAWTIYRNGAWKRHLGAVDQALRSGAGPGRRRAAPRRRGRTLTGRIKSTDRRPLADSPERTETIGDMLRGQPHVIRRLPNGIEVRPRGVETPGPAEAEAAADAAGEAARALADAIKEQAEQTRALKEEMAKQNAITSSTLGIGLREAQRALADMISGQLGTMTAQRMAGPSTGALARY